MHPPIRNVLLVAVATLALAAPVRAQFALIDDARVIVKYKAASTLLKESIAAEEKPAALAKAMSERTGIAFRAGASVADRTHVLFATGFTSEQLAARLAADSDVEYAVPDYKRHPLAAPNDPLYVTGPALTDSTGGPPAGQWYLRAPSSDVVVVDQCRAGLERHAPAARRSSSRCSIPACASTIPTCSASKPAATCCPATTWSAT